MRPCVLVTILIAGAAGARIRKREMGLTMDAANGPDASIYNVPPRTVNGCDCTSECKTELAFSCYSNPICTVDINKCPNASSGRIITEVLKHFDYCKYNEDAEYESLKADEKEALLLEKVMADTESGEYANKLKLFKGVMTESVRVTMEAQADVFPEKRGKWIHSVGAVASIKWVSSGNHNYSGLFTGADHGLIRFSSAKEPDSSGFTPGVAVKIFRSGRPSANFVAMPSLDGQKCSEENFFKKDFKSHISNTNDIALTIVASKFWQASYCPLMVGLSDFADDPAAGNPEFPFMLTLRAPQGTDVSCPCGNYAQCLANIGELETGTTVFEVFATKAPFESADQKIGSIVLTSSPTTTKFGDEELFFKHQYMEEDFQLRPDWLEAIQRNGAKDNCGMKAASSQGPPISAGCKAPFDPAPTPSMRDDDGARDVETLTITFDDGTDTDYKAQISARIAEDAGHHGPYESGTYQLRYLEPENKASEQVVVNFEEQKIGINMHRFWPGKTWVPFQIV